MSTSTEGVALITGASSGIGAALAKRFAAGGHPLVLVARSGDKLARLAESLTREYGVKILVQAADLAKPDAARALSAALKRRRVAVDILVNNAGALQQGPFIAIPPRRHQDLIDLNVSGLTAMLAQFLPAMRRRRRGRVRPRDARRRRKDSCLRRDRRLRCRWPERSCGRELRLGRGLDLFW